METNSKPVVYLTAADIAAHFGVPANTVHLWRERYGPGRSPEAIEKAPTCPQPDPVRVGVKRPVAVWSEGRLPEWDAWRASLPGRGAGGGRRHGTQAAESTIRRRAVKGWSFMELPAGEAAAIRAFLDGGDPSGLPERWLRAYEREQQIAAR